MARRAAPIRIADAVPSEMRLAMGVRCYQPGALAALFAVYVGQFYDRAQFDQLARLTANLYQPFHGRRFRECLDRQLARREREPVCWEPEEP